MTYRELIGIPFVDEGRNPATGLDCWGLVMAAMRKHGKKVPDFKISCYDPRVPGVFQLAVIDWEKAEGPEEGAVVAMANDPERPGVVQHFGVCIGEGRFIHAMEKIKSCAPRLDHPFWKNKVRGFYKWTG
jgi:cell wall-associated NlpC family hydrolase